MAKFRLVDLCCSAASAAAGYSRAGFEVLGVDIKPQPHYPFEFRQGDVLNMDLPEADVYHASPPCQLFSVATKRYRNDGKEYPDVLTPLRQKLLKTGKPFIIENVMGAPLRKDLVLCGEMFGKRVIRHRIFELHGCIVYQPPHVPHRGYATGLNGTFQNKVREDFYYYTVCGHGRRWPDRMENWSRAMGIYNMTRKEITQAIPPAYSHYIGRQVIRQLSH